MKQRGLIVLLVALVLVIGVSTVVYNRYGAGRSAELMPFGDAGSAAGTDDEPGETASPEVVDEPGELEADGGEDEEIVYAALDFTMYDGDGNALKLSDLYGKPIVLNFWASWCPPCKMEMPEFDEVWQEMGEEVHFVMVDMTDGREETQQSGEAHIEEMGYGFPVYFDLDLEAYYTYQVTSIPTTYFISAEGNLVTGARGSINKDTLLKGIELASEAN